MTRSRAGAALAALLALTASACRRAPDDAPAPAASPAPAPPPPPVDHLAEGELAEGDADGFGVRFPAGFKATVLGEYARAEGAAPPRAVERYYRDRLQQGIVHADGRAVTFARTKKRDGSGPLLEVRVVEGDKAGVTVVEIRNREPRRIDKASARMTDDERYRAAGIDRQGHIVNWKKME